MNGWPFRTIHRPFCGSADDLGGGEVSPASSFTLTPPHQPRLTIGQQHGRWTFSGALPIFLCVLLVVELMVAKARAVHPAIQQFLNAIRNRESSSIHIRLSKPSAEPEATEADLGIRR